MAQGFPTPAVRRLLEEEQRERAQSVTPVMPTHTPLEPFDSHGGLSPAQAGALTEAHIDLQRNAALAAKLPTDVSPDEIARGNFNSLRELVKQQVRLARLPFLDSSDLDRAWRNQMRGFLDKIEDHVADLSRDDLLRAFKNAQGVAAVGVLYVQEPAVRAQLISAEPTLAQVGVSASPFARVKLRLEAIQRYIRHGTVPAGESVQSMLRAVVVDMPREIEEERKKHGLGPLVDAAKKVAKAVPWVLGGYAVLRFIGGKS